MDCLASVLDSLFLLNMAVAGCKYACLSANVWVLWMENWSIGRMLFFILAIILLLCVCLKCENRKL